MKTVYKVTFLIMILIPLHGLKLLSSQDLPNDPFFEYQWNLYNDGNISDSSVAGADINILRAWKITEGSSDVVIVMFDRGIDLDSITGELHHPEMNDSDMHLLGKNFTTAWGGDTTNVRDGHPGGTGGHGTWVSGVIFAEKNNNEGIAGIAPGVKALHHRVAGGNPTESYFFRDAALDVKTNLNDSDKRYIVNYSSGWDIHPDNSSAQYDQFKDLEEGVQHLDTAGVILVSISHNFNRDSLTYPAKFAGSQFDYDHVIAVGSTDQKDERCVCTDPNVHDICSSEKPRGSHYGPELTIMAPGVRIPSTDLIYAENHIYGDGSDLTGPYRKPGICSGSMAAPHVSGVAGLILSINNQLSPGEVRAVLKQSAAKVGGVNYDGNGFHEEMGFGRLDAYQALIYTIANHGAVLGKDKEDVQLILEDDIALKEDVAIADNTLLTIEAPDGNVTISSESGTVTIGGQWSGGGSAKITGDDDVDGFVSPDLEEVDTRPGRFHLSQNYPNPFNPETVFRYELPVESEVVFEVYDILGRRVAVLVNERKSAGSHQATWDASNMASGTYIYRLQAGDFVQSRQMLLIK